jgi:hypothetical protein
MDERWRILTRVRDLRTRLAMNEMVRERRAQARAQAALEQARTRKTQLEEQASWASGLLADRSCVPGEDVYDATQAQQLLDFVASARLKAQAAAAPIRRAQLQSARAEEAVAEASAKYRREAGRKEAVESQWQENLRVARRLQVEREDATRAEERVGSHIARRLREVDEYGDGE